MADKSFQERTEAATPKKREDARQKGQVLVSREVSSVSMLFMILGVFFFMGADMFEGLSDLMKNLLAQSGTLQVEPLSATRLLTIVFSSVCRIMLPLMLTVVIAGIASHVSQIGVLFTLKPLKPTLAKLNPAKGFRRLFSLRSLVEVLKAFFKILVIGLVASLTLKKHLVAFPSLMQMEVVDILAFAGRLSLQICFFTGLTLIFLAAVDYLFQRWHYEKDLKMTRQEVKEEFKQREGDPAIKARIRRIQAEMARRRMMADVPLADVVITNPTHLAVALKFDAESMAAPRVLAKGAGFVAERIREVAEAAHIPIVEQRPLARALFQTVDIGDDIPVGLYRAVAEILAYVYHLKEGRPVRGVPAMDGGSSLA